MNGKTLMSIFMLPYPGYIIKAVSVAFSFLKFSDRSGMCMRDRVSQILTECFEEVSKKFDNGMAVNAVHADFSMAFDNVSLGQF